MKEKFQVANDTSYLERSNLQQILQKHNSLESELSANTRRVEHAVLQGKTLVQDRHFASITVEKTIDEIQRSWNELNEKAKDRGVKLHQASEKKAFDWSIEDFIEWLLNVEKALTSEDFGQDLNSVNSLIKKQGLLEADIVAHRERLNEISRRVEEFEETNHFQLDEIRQKADEITKRYMYDVNILACTL
jgi:tetrahydromethanopterin S-methyltransferase subunit G